MAVNVVGSLKSVKLSRFIYLLLASLLINGPAFAQNCGGEAEPVRQMVDEIISEIDSGEYHVAMPDGWQGGPAVIYLHGYGGSGAKVIGNKGLVARFTERGYAVIAPTALPWLEGKPADWALRDGWVVFPRYDLNFIRDVLSDAVARASVDPDRVLLTGFSRGGSMVWEIACLRPNFARGYAPVSGGFWLPATQDCVGPVNMLHIHGFTDEVVPLEGLTIDNPELGRFTQADIWEGLQLWRRENACPSKPSGHEVTDGLWRKRWTCESGSLEIALHSGGHRYPKGWVNLVLDWFEGLEG